MRSRSGFIDATQVTSQTVGQFHRYWRSKCADAAIPPGAAIDPVEIPRLLPHLVIAELQLDPMRVRYRLVGTRVVEIDGFDYTNRYLDECNFAVEPLLVECYRRLVATAAPVFAYYEWFKKDWRGARGSVGASETGFFPLGGDGNAVDHVISIADSELRPA